MAAVAQERLVELEKQLPRDVVPPGGRRRFRVEPNLGSAWIEAVRGWPSGAGFATGRGVSVRMLVPVAIVMLLGLFVTAAVAPGRR
jgi:hypothetical protein